MKKLITLLLAFVLAFSFCSVSAFAEETTDSSSSHKASDMFSSYDDGELAIITLAAVAELYNRGLITESAGDKVFAILLGKEDDLPNEYSFGQGTFVVGQDLKAGTYDITCESSSGSAMDDSMAGLSDFYASQGMSEYADMFGSLSGMYDTIGGMTVMTYKPNTNYYDQYLTLKTGETARIILEDGGKIEISDGTAKLVWIR